MAGIMWGEFQKKVLRIGVAAILKQVKKANKNFNIHSDMENCGNEALAQLYHLLMVNATFIKSTFGQREAVEEFGTFGLWAIYKDTAYGPVFFWMLFQMLSEPEKWLRLIAPYVVPPSQWYSNKWIDSKKATDKKKQEGQIPEWAKSLEESIFTPSEQQARLKRIKVKK